VFTFFITMAPVERQSFS